MHDPKRTTIVSLATALEMRRDQLVRHCMRNGIPVETLSRSDGRTVDVVSEADAARIRAQCSYFKDSPEVLERLRRRFAGQPS